MKQMIKRYLKSLKREDRALRTIARGRRLIVKQNAWLHFNAHPWDAAEEKKEE